MHTMNTARRTLLATLLTAGAISVHAADAPYYNPANSASTTGKTTAYELFRTIGCPGKGILEAPCMVPVAAPVAPPAPVVAAPVVAPVVVKPADGDNDGVVDAQDNCPTTPAGRKVNAQGCELDGDADGVVDSQDNCPTTPAGRKVNALGCEIDTDGDGVVDALDKCPTTPAGRAVNADGCELDGDGDGVVDGNDQCPTTPAGRKVNAKGCDIDSDGDGVIDISDKCPDTPAGDRVDTSGCSLPNVMTLKGVTFDNDKASLQASSTTTLDEAVATLKRYPGLKVEVAGHTDNVGNAAHNLDLSQRRAKTVMDYFVSHGVAADRLSAKGYGEAEPVADNGKPAGRALNRRVELRAMN